MKRGLDILVLSDLHYTGADDSVSSIPERRSELGAVLLEKALNRLRHEGLSVDLVVLLGDMLDDGAGRNADRNIRTIAKTAKALKLPLLAVPGNHDGDLMRYAQCFGCEPGLHRIGGYGFLVFHDAFGPGDVAARSEDDMSLLARVASENPELPLVALQHNPLHPSIQSEYPFMLTNTDSVMSGYADAAVILSLSGHYHPGQSAHRVGDMTVYTVPSLCEAPFRFAHVRLEDRTVVVHEHALRMETPALVDTHCHTEYAYCGTTVAAESNIAIGQAMGLQGQCFTEHAFQLYFEQKDAWGFEWQTNDALVEQAWGVGPTRMPDFRRFAAAIRSDSVRVGLEVDLRADGSLLLAEEDYEGWDLLIGSVHSLPGCTGKELPQAETEKRFLQQTETLLTHPIQVLAHPFRFFRRSGLEPPTHLYRTVAEWLAEREIAAEVNFHMNIPDPRFVEECLARGVKIALGTDSHALWEVGELAPHLNVLRKAGVLDTDLEEILYRC